MTPCFLNGCQGDLFVQIVASQSPGSPHWIIHFPAFAEEMNKSRPMVSAQARRLSAQGYNVVIPDWYGTGDSCGDFGQATWSTWRADAEYLIEWLQRQGAQSIRFWGLRLGALLAAEVATTHPPAQLIFWQPVLSGEQALTQFLRVRMVASMVQGEKESAAALKQRLLAGESLEVAGYQLSSELARALMERKLAQLELPESIGVQWYEVVGDADKGLLPVSANLVQRWQSQGRRVETASICAPAFWATQEITMAGALLDATGAALPSLTWGQANPVDLPEPVTNQTEQAVTFTCQDCLLTGLLHRAAEPARRGVMIVVGGPQYRVGSHRQFVHLARALAQAGYPVLRFDYRGMGDAEGDLAGFEQIEPDIKAALDYFFAQQPALQDVVLWGLCDGASASSFYAANDPRVGALVLLNPWVRSEAGEAKAYIRHYYLQRLFSKQLWRQLWAGQLSVGKALAGVLEQLNRLKLKNRPDHGAQEIESGDLTTRMWRGLQAFPGKVQLIISGNDLTAAEFDDALGKRKDFRSYLAERGERCDLPEADHTFSRKEWRDRVAQLTIDWMKSW